MCLLTFKNNNFCCFLQIASQLKILTTAVFSVFMLKKQLTKMQWFSLIVLFLGVVIAQIQPDTMTQQSATINKEHYNGFAAVVISSLMSGFAGIYFEKILKGSEQSIWVRNVQLGFWGVIIGSVIMYMKDSEHISEKGIYFGYDFVVWIVIFNHAVGGLLIAFVVLHTDTILKGFATSSAIILSCICSVYFFHFALTIYFAFGLMLVICSIYMYSSFQHVDRSEC